MFKQLTIFNQSLPAGLIIFLLVWELVFKGYALWRSARNKQPAWFVVLLVFNTVGLLPIIYLLFFQKKFK